MKILILSPYIPEPANFGGARRVRAIAAGLARHHSVSFLALEREDVDTRSSVASARAYCERVVVVPGTSATGARGRKRVTQLLSTLGPRSYEYRAYHHRRVQLAIDELTRSSEFDVIIVGLSSMGHYRFPLRSMLVFDEQNIDYDVLRRTSEVAGGSARRLYSLVNGLKLRREETGLWRTADGVTLTSPRDQELVQREAPGTPTAVVANGVDSAEFRPDGPAARAMTVLFFGTVGYYPNTDAVMYFLDHIFPRLRTVYPLLRFVVAGGDVPTSVRERTDAGLDVLGSVDDIRPHIASAELVVVPLRVGGGTRLKILEAMAMAKPVVSTTLGAEGLDVTHGQDILLADSPSDFARSVSALLDDAELRRRLGASGRRLVVERYDWKRAVEAMSRFCESLVVADAGARLPAASARLGRAG